MVNMFGLAKFTLLALLLVVTKGKIIEKIVSGIDKTSTAIQSTRDLAQSESHSLKQALTVTQRYIRGDQPKIPLSSKILKNPPLLSSEPETPLCRRSTPANFRVVWGIFRNFKVNFGDFLRLIMINYRI